MNKKVFTLILLAFLTMAGKAQVQTTTALTGSWTGKLEVGQMSLTLVFHLEQADGYVIVTMDSPDQSAKGIPVKKECLTDDSLAVKVEALGLTYQARLKDVHADGLLCSACHDKGNGRGETSTEPTAAVPLRDGGSDVP